MPSYNKIVINYTPEEAEKILHQQWTPEQRAEIERLAKLFTNTLEDLKKEKEPNSR